MPFSETDKIRHIGVGLITPQSSFLADQRVFPFLGILKVAGELQRNGNHVEATDLSGFANTEEIMADYLRQSRAAVYGITATTPQLPEAVRILRVIRDLKPEARVILGGTHATLSHTGYQQDLQRGRQGRGTQNFMQLQGLFDTIVAGDGEMAIFEAIDPNNKTQVIDANNRHSPLFIQRGHLEEHTWPDRSFIDEDSYRYTIDGKPAFSVIGQLGCPFECGFCSGRNTDFLRMTRTRSPENVAAEIEDVVRRSQARGNPLSGTMFYDDELNVVPSGLEDLCRNLINLQDRLGLEMRFRGFVKAERFTTEQARLMYQAGFRVLLSGVESGSAHILKVIRKKTTPEINSRCRDIAGENGLKFKALMSMGHPDESPQTVDDSVRWVTDNKPDDVDLTIITPYPGSKYYDEAEYDPEKKMWLYTEAKTGGRLWTHDMDFTREAIFYKGVPGEYVCEVETPQMTADQMRQVRDEAEKEMRGVLNLPPITSVPALQFEHTMGAPGPLPQNILRTNS